MLVGVMSEAVLDGFNQFRIWPQEVEPGNSAHRDEDRFPRNDETWLGHSSKKAQSLPNPA
jgi:hypothetical protein